MKINGVAYLISTLLLTGCGGFYTKDVYFKDGGSDRWKTSFGDDKITRFKCEDNEITVIPVILKSRKTVEEIFGIPVWPTDKELVDREVKNEMNISISYKVKQLNCSKTDIKLNTEVNSTINPIEVETVFNTGAETYCNYIFNINHKKMKTLKLIFTDNLISCSVPTLNLVKDSGYNYNYSPW